MADLMARFVFLQDAPTAEAGAFTSVEYQVRCDANACIIRDKCQGGTKTVQVSSSLVLSPFGPRCIHCRSCSRL
jgi:hypothetical protein